MVDTGLFVTTEGTAGVHFQLIYRATNCHTRFNLFVQLCVYLIAILLVRSLKRGGLEKDWRSHVSTTLQGISAL